jgi:hypothetical protein
VKLICSEQVLYPDQAIVKKLPGRPELGLVHTTGFGAGWLVVCADANGAAPKRTPILPKRAAIVRETVRMVTTPLGICCQVVASPSRIHHRLRDAQ